MPERDQIEVTLPDRVVVHLRTVMQFAEVASEYGAAVRVSAGGKDVNGKDVMDLLTLMGAGHRRISIAAKGDDASAVLRALEELIAAGFGEEA